MAEISNLVAGSGEQYWVQVIFADVGESIPVSRSLPYKMVVVSSGAISVQREDLDEEEFFCAGAFQGMNLLEIPEGVDHRIKALSPATRLTVICPESPEMRNEPKELYLTSH